MKLGLVLAGYALALILGAVAGWLYGLRFSPADDQAMGGMIAGGQMMYGAAVCGLVSLAPTGLALWFLRHNRSLWSAFSVAALAFAIGGLAAVLSPLAFGGYGHAAPWFDFVGLVSIVQMLGSPLWIGGFALFAALAPERQLRRRMLVAMAIEIGIAGCGLVHFLIPRPPI